MLKDQDKVGSAKSHVAEVGESDELVQGRFGDSVISLGGFCISSSNKNHLLKLTGFCWIVYIDPSFSMLKQRYWSLAPTKKVPIHAGAQPALLVACCSYYNYLGSYFSIA